MHTLQNENKKALILTGQAGGGHLSIAKAYEYWLSKWGYDVRVLDLVPAFNEKITQLLYKIPKTYKSLFKFTNIRPVADIMTASFYPEAELKIRKHVPDYAKYDLVISTYPLLHPHKGKRRIILLPDPITHAAYRVSPKPDFYFCFWKESLEGMTGSGIEKNKLICTGPLARETFYENARFCLKPQHHSFFRDQLNLPHDKKIVLVLAGTAWIFRSEEYLGYLYEKFKDENILFVFLCGKNAKFSKRVSRLYADVEQFRFLNWLTEQEVSLWMGAADFAIAFTLAQMSVEAGLMGLPIFIFKLIEGQEEGYREVIENRGVGMYIPGDPASQVAIFKILHTHTKTLFDKNLKLWQQELLETPEKIKNAILKIN